MPFIGLPRCPAQKDKEKIPHLRERDGRRGRTGYWYAKVDALLRGLVTHSLTESVPRVGPGGCESAAYVGGPTVLRGELIVLFIIRSDKRFGDPGNKEESGRCSQKRGGRERSYVDVILESIEFSIPLPSNLAS